MVTAGRFAARAVLAGGLALALVSAGLLVPVTADAAPFIESARLVSLSETDPATAGDANSIDPSISGDGRYVVFASAAGNIGRLGTTAHHTQVYLRDTLLGTTTVVSSASGAAGDGDSDRAAVSGDGSSVAFISTATNLVSSARGGNAQVLLWSRVTGQLSHVSVSNDPVPNAANGRAIGLAISDDGGKVVFSSNATNLVGTPTGGVFQTYSRNLSAGATALESIDPRTGAAASNDATVPAISGDGRIVTFASAARLTNIDTQGKFQVYARDGASATTEMVSVDSSGTVAGSADSFESSVSADGASVAFASEATNLTAITAYPSAGQIYLRDRGTSSTRLISVDGAGRAAGNGRSDMPEISADGSSVAFGSRATNLVPATGSLGSGSSSLPYVRSFADERTRLACVPVTAGPICDGDSGAPSLTAHGEKIIFSSSATNLVPGVPSRHAQVFLQALTPAVGAERIGGADRFAVSASTATGAFVTGVPVAYIASGVGFADALSGSAAAGAGRGPVLLVTKDSIPTLVGIELQRLKPKRIIVLGGTAVIDPTVERALVAYSP